MKYLDYPETHIMNEVGKILFCLEKRSENDLLEFAKNGNPENTLPLHFSKRQIGIALKWKSEMIPRIYFKCLMKINMNDIENPDYRRSNKQIDDVFKFAKDDLTFGGFNLEDLTSDELNRRRLELYQYVEAGKIVYCDLFVIVSVGKSLRKMKKDNMADPSFWEAVKSKREFTILDASDPQLQKRKKIVEEALAVGKKVKVGKKNEITYSKDLKRYQIKFGHLTRASSTLILPLEKMLCRNSDIDISNEKDLPFFHWKTWLRLWNVIKVNDSRDTIAGA